MLNLYLKYSSEVILKLVWQHSQIPELKKKVFMAPNVLQEFLTWENEHEKKVSDKGECGGRMCQKEDKIRIFELY